MSTNKNNKNNGIKKYILREVFIKAITPSPLIKLNSATKK